LLLPRIESATIKPIVRISKAISNLEIKYGLPLLSRAVAGYNTSTVALRVVRSDVNGTQCPAVYLDHHVPGGYKNRNLILKVGGVSDEAVKYRYGFSATRTIE
jgi:hypothetical protein